MSRYFDLNCSGLRGRRTDRSENALTADNQQERLDPRWISGFVDGEGCFRISINKQPNMSVGWQVLPEFRVVQHSRGEVVLLRLQHFFHCGKVVKNHGDRDEFRVRRLRDLEKVAEFFRNYPLQTKKKKDLELFSQVLSIIKQRDHLSREGLTRIALLAWQMNRRTKPRYLESSETLRRMSRMSGRQR